MSMANVTSPAREVGQLAERLLNSARLAATSGRGRSLAVVEHALELGRQAAVNHGARLPLHVLLDACALLDEPDRHAAWTSGIERGNTAVTERYDEWLIEFVALVSQKYSSSAGRSWLSLLCSTVGEPGAAPAEPHHWEAAYARLLASGASTRILAVWGGPREVRPEPWQEWTWESSASLQDHPLLAPACLWDRFLEAGPPSAGRAVHEAFDHAAAHFYLDSPDPDLLPHQAQRVLELRRREAREDRPRIDAYEEQHPQWGAHSLFVLTVGEYGEHLLANNSDPKIAARPLALPATKIRIHLCFQYSSAAVDRYAALTARSAGGGRERITWAGVLHGLVALLLDDWRSTLRGLPIEFHVHRLAPAPFEKKMGGTGTRWKESASAPIDPAPPGSFVYALFRRVQRLELLLEDHGVGAAPGGDAERAPPEPSFSDWWCGCMLRENVDAESPVLPRAWRHVILVDPTRRVGVIREVVRRGGRGGAIDLRPVATPALYDPGPTGAFFPLRRTALDVLLMEVHRRLRLPRR
jgi:hypothetical protein